MTLSFTVPGQPQGKQRPRIGKAGAFSRMFTPAKTQSYEAMVATFAHQAMAGAPLLEGPLEVGMDIVLEIPASWSGVKQRRAVLGELLPTTKPDIDNVEKAVFDALNGVVWRDDVQVVRVVKAKRYGRSPGVSVAVKAASAVWVGQGSQEGAASLLGAKKPETVTDGRITV